MDGYINSNINNNSDIDKHIENAYTLCRIDFSHAQLLYMLEKGNIAEKQIAALKFDYVKSDNDANAIISNLTGCDGKIREAVAQRINSLIITEPDTRPFFAHVAAEKFADATIDINANICRLVIDSAALMNDYRVFSVNYITSVLKYTVDALDELDKFIYKDKKYLINKQLFKLYWCLEAITYFQEYINTDKLRVILNRCSTQSEYTIREKTANIVNMSENFPEIKALLIADDNYYVREVFKSSMLL